jgi:lycopene cyclase domain-containing protein
MRYTYLLINFLTIIVPFLFSFGRRMQFYKQWRHFLPAMLTAAFVFWVWDYFAVLAGLWWYNPLYITGAVVTNLPVEELLFFITVPYSSVFIYHTIQYYHPSPYWSGQLPRYMRYVTTILALCAIPVWHRTYTSSVLVVGGLLYPIAMRILDRATIDRFLTAYIVSLIPMAIVNGILTALPIVSYGASYNLGVRIGTIPVEDFIYWFDLLLLNILLYSWMSSRKVTASA